MAKQSIGWKKSVTNNIASDDWQVTRFGNDQRQTHCARNATIGSTFVARSAGM